MKAEEKEHEYIKGNGSGAERMTSWRVKPIYMNEGNNSIIRALREPNGRPK
jgi:hypothetical protein